MRKQTYVYTKDKHKMLTDGFKKGSSMADLGAELVNFLSLHGVTANVYRHECQGLAENGKHNQFHIAVELVNDKNGDIIDTLPIPTIEGLEQEVHGHFSLDQTVVAAVMLLKDYREAEKKIIEAEGAVNPELWLYTFERVAEHRRMQQMLADLLAEMMDGLSGDDEEDDDEEDDDVAFGFEDEDDKDKSAREKLLKLLGDFDPDKVEPTDEGLDS
jgi:hypothetical protein